jgi:hypothetical protein
VVAAAAGVEAGQVEFAAGRFHASRVAQAGEHEAIPVAAVDALALAADADLLKVDVEGSEWPILLDSRFASLPATVVALEWHAHGCPGADARATAAAALEAGGFGLQDGPGDERSGHLWGWRDR